MLKAFTHAELELHLESWRGSFDDVALMDSPEGKRFQNAWIAARFARGFCQHVGKCTLELDLDEGYLAADFILNADGRRFDCQATETMKRGRRRGKEYKNVAAGRMPRTQLVDIDLEIRHGPVWIADSLANKVNKRYANAQDLTVVVYVNASIHGLELEAIRRECADSLKVFKSVWAITSDLIGCLQSCSEIGHLEEWGVIDLSDARPDPRALIVDLGTDP